MTEKPEYRDHMDYLLRTWRRWVEDLDQERREVCRSAESFHRSANALSR